MLDFYGVTEETWREATATVPHFCISESPAYTGRAITALGSDPEVARWSGQVVSTGSPTAGATSSRSKTVEVQDKGLPANDHSYR
jgi:hypothetical protein